MRDSPRTHHGNTTTEFLSVTGRKHGDVWMVELCGELDCASRDVLRDAFSRAMELSCARIVVDAHAVTFIDCGGLGALLEAASACSRQVVLRSPSPSVRRLTQLVGLEQVWEPANDGDDVRIA